MIDTEDHSSDPFENRLRQQLHATAEQAPITEGLGQRAHTAGTRRRRRRRLLNALPVAALLAVASLAGWSHPWSQDRVGLTPAAPATAPATASSPLTVTPDVERAVSGLQPLGLGGGNDDPTTQQIPVAAGTTPVSCARLSEHLGIALPTFTQLQGYRMLCTSPTGDAIFDRAVPPTGSGVPDAPDTEVTIFYVPPGVDERTATTAQAATAGMSWVHLSYGSDVMPVPGEGRIPGPDATAVTLSNGEDCAVVQIAESGNSIGWVSLSSGHSYGLYMYQPRTPLASVTVFGSGINVPL